MRASSALRRRDIPDKIAADGRDVTMFLANALHAADIGSTAKPSETYYRWMQGVFAEFFAQGDAQRELGLEVTPFMDRTSASIPKAQQGFLKYICQPIFTAMAQPLPTLAESAGWSLLSRRFH